MAPPRIWLVLLASALSISSSVDAFPLGFFTHPHPDHDRELIMHPNLHTTSLESMTTADDHKYFRPSGSDVSGVPKNKAPYHRAPCPALNSLANHGYLPRDGKNLTPELVKKAVMDVFNLDDRVTQMLVNTLPPTLTLADLGVHNFIEHDASMVHNDAYQGGDPSHINATLVAQLLARANKDHRLTKKEIAHWRHDREVECKATNPQYDFGLKRQASAYAEAAAFLIAMGEYASESISVEHAKSFLQMEQIPDDFERSPIAVTTTKALYVAAKIKAMASFPWELLSAY